MEISENVRKRPDFLTVLCVLTFMASITGILSNLNGYYSADEVSEMTRERLEKTKDDAMEKVKTEEQKSIMEKMFTGANDLLDTRKQKQSNLFNIMANALTLAGAVMMYRLRRSGYGVYALGIAVWILSPLVIYGVNNYMGVGMAVTLSIAGGLFLVLYGRNLRHMA